MYSKLQISMLKKEFYTTFGKYMAPIPNANGEEINWINYHTGIKHIYFRIDVEKNHASIGIELTQPLPSERLDSFESLLQLKNLFHQHMSEDWIWEAEVETDRNKTISRISHSIQEVSFFNKVHWPQLISYFKPRLIALDDFWHSIKHQFLP